ncbi:MAG: hypothetical protein HY909_30490 [Deltaproteobacteria bacterium]|nr:hypothetical protein [Deltaproteobacteria bacterium]
MDLSHLVSPTPNLERLQGALEGCGNHARRHAIAGLAPRDLARLVDLAADAEGLSLEALVPAGTDALVEVIHHGKNSLPLFSHFQKRFCRPDGDTTDTLWGYNHQFWGRATGPGYFLARVEGKELVIDYGSVPAKKPVGKPEGWPEVLPNEARLGRLVWVGMVDRLRRVSDHVTIGRAWRGGKASDDWFALTREDRPG